MVSMVAPSDIGERLLTRHNSDVVDVNEATVHPNPLNCSSPILPRSSLIVENGYDSLSWPKLKFKLKS